MTLHGLIRSLEEGILLFNATIIHHVVTYWLMSNHFSLRDAIGIFDFNNPIEFIA